jgi:hypothetical protein
VARRDYPLVKPEDIKPNQCRWPFGVPCTPEFRFCGRSPVKPGRPYCGFCMDRHKPYAGLGYVRKAAAAASANPEE